LSGRDDRAFLVRARGCRRARAGVGEAWRGGGGEAAAAEAWGGREEHRRRRRRELGAYHGVESTASRDEQGTASCCVCARRV
jgi:hypothetical protein